MFARHFSIGRGRGITLQTSGGNELVDRHLLASQPVCGASMRIAQRARLTQVLVSYRTNNSLALCSLVFPHNADEFCESEPVAWMGKFISALDEGRVRMSNLYRLSDFLDCKIGQLGKNFSSITILIQPVGGS